MAPEQVELVAKYADVLQIGARNMQNYNLLHAVGKTDKVILLKRGMSATAEELLMAAEYVLSNGNRRVILCERGIRTFETATRNTTDINAIPVLQAQTHLPVILDPSHSTGKWEYVLPIARAAIAAGADGLIVEVQVHHPRRSRFGWRAIAQARKVRPIGAPDPRRRPKRSSGKSLSDFDDLVIARLKITKSQNLCQIKMKIAPITHHPPPQRQRTRPRLEIADQPRPADRSPGRRRHPPRKRALQRRLTLFRRCAPDFGI
jgi:hypothetical protein